MSFTKIEVYPYALTFNQYDKPQYRQCQAVDQVPVPYGTYGYLQPKRCGADAMVIVARTSEESGRRYEDAMCDGHAAPWKAAMEPSVEETKTGRWVSKTARVYPDSHCMLCGSNWGISQGEERVCNVSVCQACGSRQCSVNGLGHGACSVCYIGLLGMPWMQPGSKRCNFVGCQEPAVAIARKRLVCRAHLERGKTAGYVAGCLEERAKRFKLVDDSGPFPRLGAK